MKPTFSVIVPTYGRENELYRALNSLERQTYKNFEVILVDDNAQNIEIRNRIKSKLKEYSKKIDLKYIANLKNLGGAETRNIGIKNANGKYVAFLDDDDKFLDNKLEVVFNNIRNNQNQEYDMIYHYCESRNTKTDQKICEYKNFIGKNENPILKHLCSNICATTQLVVKKSILEKINFFENVKAKQDYLLILKIVTLPNIKLKCIKSILSIYYEQGEERISTASLRRIKYEKKAMKYSEKYIELFSLKEKKLIELEYLKRLFGISYLLNDKKRMKYYLKKILIIKFSIYEIIKYFIGINKIEAMKNMYLLYKK